MALARQKIIAHLKKNRAVSAREIARALKMSPPNVRHHLGVLHSDGRVDITETRPRTGKGRPEKLYSLPQSEWGDNLPALVNALLTETGPQLNIAAMANHILNSSQFANLPMPKRLALLVEKLSEMHYQARWEAAADGPHVIFGRCPYSKVIEDHPELCKIDAVMLEHAFSRFVQRMDKNEKMVKGLCPFIFKFG